MNIGFWIENAGIILGWAIACAVIKPKSCVLGIGITKNITIQRLLFGAAAGCFFLIFSFVFQILKTFLTVA